MSSTDTTESELESTIVQSLLASGYVPGRSEDYDRDHAVDLVKLQQFLFSTQPKAISLLGIDKEGIKLQQFLSRLQGEVAKRGVVDVLRKGINHGPAFIDLFYGSPSQEPQGGQAICCQYLQRHPPVALQPRRIPACS